MVGVAAPEGLWVPSEICQAVNQNGALRRGPRHLDATVQRPSLRCEGRYRMLPTPVTGFANNFNQLSVHERLLASAPLKFPCPAWAFWPWPLRGPCRLATASIRSGT